MPWTEADDTRVRELCKTLDVGKLTKCPKCGMGDGGKSEMMLAHFCTHKYCPFRDWEQAKKAADRAAEGGLNMADTALTMQKLLERLKEAREPDRVLDRDIARLVNGKPYGWLHPCMSAWGKGVPHYTQSFEAALTLLPSCVFVEVSGGTDTLQPGVWPAVSLRWLPPGQTDPKKWHGTVQGAPSFALAMCRAAIDVYARSWSPDVPICEWIIPGTYREG